MSGLDYVIIVAYFLAMVAAGWWGYRRAKSTTAYLLADRRLGYFWYSNTFAASVLGGASTVGGVRLGYDYGISGMWMVVMIGLGMFALAQLLSRQLARIKVFTTSEVLEKRYNAASRLMGGVITVAYTLMVAVSATIALGTLFDVFLGLSSTWAVVIGGGVVLIYAVLGGMWSITLTDLIQWSVMTVGMFLLFLPFTISKAGGWGVMWDKLPDSYSSLSGIGGSTIWMYFVIFVPVMIIGQDMWQRVFTAKSEKVARWGGTASALYMVLYGVAGGIIGAGIKVMKPALESSDTAFAEGAKALLPMGVTGIVVAAALAAIMSTSAGCIIASSTTLANDVIGRFMVKDLTEKKALGLHRWSLFAISLVVIVMSLAINDIVQALTLACDLVVAALFAPLLSAFFWKRATSAGCIAGIIVGTITMAVMMSVQGIYANSPITYSIVTSTIATVIVSLLSPKTSAAKQAEWALVSQAHWEEAKAAADAAAVAALKPEERAPVAP